MIIDRMLMDDIHKALPAKIQKHGYHLIIEAADEKNNMKMVLLGQSYFVRCKEDTVTVIMANTDDEPYVLKGENLCAGLPLMSFSMKGFNGIEIDSDYQMFAECISIKDIDLSDIDFRNIHELHSTFFCCHMLERIIWPEKGMIELDNIWHTFLHCYALKELDLSVFNLDGLLNIDSMPYNEHRSSLELNYFNAMKWSICSAFMGTKINKLILRDDFAHRILNYVINKDKIFPDCEVCIPGQKAEIWEETPYKLDKLIIDRLDSVVRQLKGKDKLEECEICFERMKESIDCYVDPVIEKTDFGPFKVIINDDIIHIYSDEKIHVYNGLRLFEGLKVKRISFSDWVDTSECVYMREMFKACSMLEELDLSCFDTSQLAGAESMFKGCKHLKRLILPEFENKRRLCIREIFKNCTKLKEIVVDGHVFDDAEKAEKYIENRKTE